MWDVLKDYPAARVRLEAIAVKRLEKYRKEPLKKSKFLHCCSQKVISNPKPLHKQSDITSFIKYLSYKS